MTTSPVRASASFPSDRSSPTDARRFVADHLARWGVSDPDRDVELLVSELTANAVLHAGSPFDLDVELDGAVVRLAVRDDEVDVPRLRSAEPSAVSGRGLLIVDRVADRWGVDAGPHGKVVWCEVTVTAPGR